MTVIFILIVMSILIVPVIAALSHTTRHLNWERLEFILWMLLIGTILALYLVR
jgi:hypothetical protein